MPCNLGLAQASVTDRVSELFNQFKSVHAAPKAFGLPEWGNPMPEYISENLN
jgi:hypothetical protein